MLADAVKAEVEDFLGQHKGLRDSNDRQAVVRNGYMPERNIQTGIGAVPVKAPRLRYRGDNKEFENFTSKLLPPYLRKTRSIEEMIPWLYLKGVSTGDFTEALTALLGADAPGLSASTVSRLKESWKDDYADWRKRDLRGKQYVYIWADGIYLSARMDNEKQCILVIIGILENGISALFKRQRRWQKLHGFKLQDNVIRGVKFADGVEELRKAA